MNKIHSNKDIFDAYITYAYRYMEPYRYIERRDEYWWLYNLQTNMSEKEKMKFLKIKTFFQLADYPNVIIIQHINGEEVAVERCDENYTVMSYKNFKLDHGNQC